MEIQVNTPTDKDTNIGLAKVFFGVITSPKVTFERLSKSPRTWLPSLLLVILTILFTLPFFAKYQEYNLLILKKTLTQIPPGMNISRLAVISTVSTLIGLIVLAFFKPLILAGLIKLLNFVMGEETEFKKIWTVTIFASVPSLLNVFVGNVLMLTANADQLIITKITGLSLAALVSPESVSIFIFRFLATLNLFTIWSLVLTVIGVTQVFRSKISRVSIVIFGVWLVFSFISSYMGQAQMSKLLGL